MLTLQGAIAHVDAPIETGPTLLLPFSQAYRGRLPRHLPAPDFRGYFDAHAVQLPLKKGDMLFFSPALFHAAGTNRTKRREADGQPLPGLLRLWPRDGEHRPDSHVEGALPAALAKARANGTLAAGQIAAAIASCAEGYPFPTNLDSDPPLGGLAPKSQAKLFHEALEGGWDAARFNAALDAQAVKKLP